MYRPTPTVTKTHALLLVPYPLHEAITERFLPTSIHIDFIPDDVVTEFLQICKAVAIGFAVMGFIGYFVKLIHIPMYVTCAYFQTKSSLFLQ